MQNAMYHYFYYIIYGCKCKDLNAKQLRGWYYTATNNIILKAESRRHDIIFSSDRKIFKKMIIIFVKSVQIAANI